MRRTVLRFVFAGAVGWGTMFALVFLGGLLARGLENFVSPSWISTFELTVNCGELAGAGYAAVRVNRGTPLATALLFAATLACFDWTGFGVALNVPWLLRLTRNVVSDSRFFDSWLTAAGTDLLLTGCVIGGGMLARPREAPVSLGVRATR